MYTTSNNALLAHKTSPDQPTTQVAVGLAVFGKQEVPLIAGPCAIESLEQMEAIAKTMNALGIHCLRGGAFKPRTSPYSFQGLGKEGLEILSDIKTRFGLAAISEVMTPEQIELSDPYLDCFQVGSRNMQNFELLKELSRQPKPVLLKRGFVATLDEFLYAAEYILMGGLAPVILCERGIRGFDQHTRNVIDLGAVAALKELSHLPIVVDPSHACGKKSLVSPLAKAALAVGADGVMIEVHPNPEQALSDKEQALSLEDLQAELPQWQAVATAINRPLASHIKTLVSA